MKKPSIHLMALVLMALAAWLLPQPTLAQFANGADVSWLTEQEASGVNFYSDNGTQQDLFQILGDHDINAIRLRVWVNPADGYHNLNDVIAKAVRAKNAGMRIMIDFHYSDTWADPAHQSKPAAWSNYTFQQLMDNLYSYTVNALNQIRSAGVYPEWVQIGNETNDGMLWPTGRASQNMQNFAWLVTTGHNAVKAVDPNIKTIVHISNGYDNSLFRWIFDGITSNGGQFDAIGMSLYPEPTNWQTLNQQTLSNMQDMVSRYGKEVVICEVGMRSDEPQACQDFLEDIIAKTKSVGGIGVFYWEPQAYGFWKSYGKDAWQDNGRPSIAMDAFLGGGSSCSPSSITPYLQVNGGSWLQSSTANLSSGGTVKFGPQPTQGGSWSWSGPGFSASSREVTLSNVSSSGTYTATYTNSCGAQSSQAFQVNVTGSSKTIVVRARGTAGTEHINLWVGSTLVNNWTLGTSMQSYSATTSASGTVSVEFDNDESGRDVQIDYITVSGSTRQAENQSANTGVWQNGSCGGSNSEWLHCNGSISFGTASRATSSSPLAAPKLLVYPNPVTDQQLTLAGLSDPAEVTIYTLTGQRSWSGSVAAGTQTIDLNLPAGSYLLQVRTPQGVQTQPLVVQ